MFLILYLVCSTLLLPTCLCEDTLHFITILPPPSCWVLPFRIVSKFASVRGEKRKLRKCRQQLYEWHAVSETQLVWRHLREQEFCILCLHASCLFQWPDESCQIPPVFFPTFWFRDFAPNFCCLRATRLGGGEDEEWNYYPVTLTLELAATKMVIIRLFTETRPTSQSFSQTTGHVY